MLTFTLSCEQLLAAQDHVLVLRYNVHVTCVLCECHSRGWTSLYFKKQNRNWLTCLFFTLGNNSRVFGRRIAGPETQWFSSALHSDRRANRISHLHVQNYLLCVHIHLWAVKFFTYLTLEKFRISLFGKRNNKPWQSCALEIIYFPCIAYIEN